MSALTIRGIDPEVHARLRIEAARHGHSMEAEVREILTERFGATASAGGLGTRVHARFAEIGHPELDVPRRTDSPRAAEFDL